MKSDYITRARKFLMAFIPYLENFSALQSPMVWKFQYAAHAFNEDFHRKVIIANGATRVVIMTSDYVIKFDYSADVACYGGCEKEVSAYKEVVEEGFGYLFAETTPFTFNQYHFCIMPRIKGKTYCGWNGIYDFLTDEEADFIDDHFYDLHNENWKLVNGNPIIFDYAANNL